MASLSYDYNRQRPLDLSVQTNIATRSITFEPAIIEHLFSQCKTAHALDQAATSEGLQRGLRKMRHLTLPTCPIYLSSLEALNAHATSLRSLCIFDAPALSRTLHQMGAFSRIKELTVVSDGQLSTQAEALIFSLKKLERLTLRCEVSRTQLLRLTHTPRRLKVTLVRFHKLMWSAIMRRDDLLQKALANSGADINGVDEKRMTLLTRAVAYGKFEAMLPLMAAGANPLLQDGKGSTPTVYAALRGDEPALRLLIRSGANPHQVDAQGRSLLDLAIKAASFDAVKYLISTGVDTRSVNARGFTPLIEAALHANLALVKLLVKAGADPLVTSECGLTCFHYAVLAGKQEVADYLHFCVEATAATASQIVCMEV